MVLGNGLMLSSKKLLPEPMFTENNDELGYPYEAMS